MMQMVKLDMPKLKAAFEGAKAPLRNLGFCRIVSR